MTEEIRVLKRFESFVLGKCNCGCNEDIPLYSLNNIYLRQWKKGHHFKKERNPRFNNGIKIIDGYIYCASPDHPNKGVYGYVAKHRLIYEQYLKIIFDEDVFIPRDYDIHHINNKKDDNRLINLTCLSNSKHVSLHFKKDMINRYCLICNSKETYKNKNKYSMWYKYKNGFICMTCNYKYN